MAGGGVWVAVLPICGKVQHAYLVVIEWLTAHFSTYKGYHGDNGYLYVLYR